MSNELIALYEIRRQSFLLGYIQVPHQFSAALAYAYDRRIAPILNQELEREAYGCDPFEEVYAVKASFIEKLLKFIDSRVSADDLTSLSFYKLEEKFCKNSIDRTDLKHALNYTRISGRFNEAVWKAIDSDAPTEGKPIADSFSPNEIEFS